MEYLNQVLGIQVVYKEGRLVIVPNYIDARYTLQRAALDSKDVVFVYPKTDLDAVTVVKKHLDRIQRDEGVPAVLVLNHMTYRQKEYLLREHIPFIVEGKQIYLPFMAVYLQEKCDAEKYAQEALLPSAQLLLLYYIYHGCGELLTSEAGVDLGLTPKSISRASVQLTDKGLLQMEMRGVHKVIFSDKTPKEIFCGAMDYLRNPVKRIIYVPKSEIHQELLMSGYTALSEYSMLNPTVVCYLAADSISEWEKVATKKLQDYNDQYAVELWMYDPRKLANGLCVDRLSLALSLRGDRDERTEEAVEEMCEQLWRDIDGQRS